MKRILIAIALSVAATPAALADNLKDLAEKVITERGYWCGKATDVIPDDWNSSPNKRVVIVTCDDGAEYVRYRMTINRAGTSATIEEL